MIKIEPSAQSKDASILFINTLHIIRRRRSNLCEITGTPWEPRSLSSLEKENLFGYILEI